jgi:hypothetical protein
MSDTTSRVIKNLLDQVGALKAENRALEAPPEDTVTVDEFLARICYSAAEATKLKARKPNESDVAELLHKMISSVPFENLGQHAHPAAEGVAAVAAVMPSLDTGVSLTKIVMKNRGGFCLEITPCFAWLLRKLNYQVRIANSNVITPGGAVPGHIVLLIDGLRSNCALLVDPGFGDYIRIPIPMSAKAGGTMHTDGLGDVYSLQPTTDYGPRFNTVLMRSRKTGMMGTPCADLFGMPDMPAATTPAESMLIFNDADDLTMDHPDFAEGMASVLSILPENMFAQKRICFTCTAEGYKFLGKDYIKEKVNGVEVRRTPIKCEGEWRKVAEGEFGIRL